MATETLRFLIEAKTDGAVRGLKAVEKELDQLEKDAKAAGLEFDRVAEKSSRLNPLQSAISKVSDATGLSVEKVKQLGLTAGTAAAGLAVAFGVKSVQAASDLNEQLSRSNVVFGQASGKIQQFAKSADSIGLSTRAALEAAGGFGTLFTNIGKTQEQSAQMSEQLVRLAADLASFSNTSLEDALAAIQSGLNGEQEPLRRYAVFLSDATLRQRALADGLVQTTSTALTPAQRALAAYNEILGQTSLQQGDFARTQDGLANSSRTLQAKLEDLEASIGEKLIPAVTAVVNKLNEIHTPDGLIQTKNAAEQAAGPLEKIHDAFNKINVDIPIFGKLFDPTPFIGTRKLVDDTFKAVDKGKGLIDAAGKATGVFTTKVDLNTSAWQDVEDAEQRTLAQAQAIAPAVAAANGAIAHTFSIATQSAAQLNAQLAGTAALFNAISQGQQAIANQRADEGPGSHAPAPQVNEVLLSFGEGLSRYQAGLASATSAGVSSGLGSSEVHDAAKELADYLRSVAEQRISQLGSVFDSISSHFSLEDAKASVDEITQKIADLRNEGVSNKQAVAQQQSLVGQLLQQSLQITPREQLTIDRAQQAYDDVLARFNGTATSTTAAPGSSFLGPTSISVAGPKATLTELLVAEQDLADAKAAAVGPTAELTQAQQKLDDLRQRQKDIPKEIADAERDLTRAKASLVEAQRHEVDAGQALVDLAPDIVDWYTRIGRQAGLTTQDIAAMNQAIGATAAAAGLVDVFGNGSKFATPSDANAILSYISGINGGGPISKFADGGYVPGPVGRPQLAMVHGGELILNRSQQASAGGGINLTVNAGWGADGAQIGREIVRMLNDEFRRGNKPAFAA